MWVVIVSIIALIILLWKLEAIMDWVLDRYPEEDKPGKVKNVQLEIEDD